MESFSSLVGRPITVAEFFERSKERLQLKRHTDESFAQKHELNSSRVQKLGLALSGFADSIHAGRIQIFGNSERSYLARLDADETREAFARLDSANISCVLCTVDVEPPEILVALCKTREIPLFSSPVASSDAISAIAEVLSDALAPAVTIHGVMMEVFGIGVLIVGESGIGKSECALDLITRGHRLISDDSVMIRRVADRLIATAPESIRDYLEIRGLGILNARQLFGVSALASSCEIKFCLEFAGDDRQATGDRLGLEPAAFQVLNVTIPKYPIPVVPGRNLATLAEAAVRVFVSRLSGDRGLEQLLERHSTEMRGE